MNQQFSAAPKVVKPKNKYKEEPEEQEQDQIKLIYNNLMWDKRIFRGNTYSAIVISKKNDEPYDSSKAPLRTQKPAQETSSNFQNNKRANIEIFTDQFVESLTDKPPHYEYAAQTQTSSQEKIIRHRMEAKNGLDIETQIWDDELFDFDYQVESLLNVLCGRTLQISRMEVLQQEELRIMTNRQQQLRLYEKEQNKKIQNMYDAEDKLQQENLKNIQNFKKEKEKKIKTHRKVFSRVIAKEYLKNIKQNTFNYVQGNGFFRNVIDIRLISEVLPKIYTETAVQTNQSNKYSDEAQKILQDARSTIIKEHAWAKQVERTRRKQITDKRQQKAREKKERGQMSNEQQQMRKYLAQLKILAEQQQTKKKEQAERVQGAVQQS